MLALIFKFQTYTTSLPVIYFRTKTLLTMANPQQALEAEIGMEEMNLELNV